MTFSLVIFQLFFVNQQIMFERDIFLIGAWFFSRYFIAAVFVDKKKISLCVSRGIWLQKTLRRLLILDSK